MSTDKKHQMIISNRESMQLLGVTEVINFTEDEILLESNLGDLRIKGDDLHILHLDLEKKELKVEGHIVELSYDQLGKAEGFIKRLFK